VNQMKDEMLKLAETPTEWRLLERWLGPQDREFTARCAAWEEVRARRVAPGGRDSAARELGLFAARALYA